MSFRVPGVGGNRRGWRARSWYWKGCGLFLFGAASAIPLLSGADDAAGAAIAMLLLVSPAVLWLWRIAAWEEPAGLAVRNLFGTRRIPWHAIEKLELSGTFWSTDWSYVAVRHDGQKTHVKALIVVFPFSTRSVVAEVRDLASRRGLPIDEASIEALAGPGSGSVEAD